MELNLFYDDRYTFPSPVVSASESLFRADGCTVTARGIGSGEILLENEERYSVTVSPAPLTVFLITGQSNGEGSNVSDPEICALQRHRSVICEEGQIYTTYGWSTTGHGIRQAGIENETLLTPETAPAFTARSLTDTVSRAGTPLLYPLNSFTAEGKGKSGFDSALAWNWHRLTGDKVWVINCAAGSTAVGVWQPGETRYENCVALMAEVNKTLTEEVTAGRYELKNYVNFWLQGESDRNMEEAEYYSLFRTMYESVRRNTVLCGRPFDGLGILAVRAFVLTNDERDIADNGPRLAQKRAIADTDGVFEHAFRACEVNDLWISDPAVEEYWKTRYPYGRYPFPLRGEGYENPTTIAEVHNSVHYFQIGYNELGLVSAEESKKYFGR